MKINFGIVAAVVADDNNIEVVHFCGYENEPKEADWDNLKHELETDPEFDCIGRADLIYLPATQEMIDFYVQKVDSEWLDEI